MRITQVTLQASRAVWSAQASFCMCWRWRRSFLKTDWTNPEEIMEEIVYPEIVYPATHDVFSWF